MFKLRDDQGGVSAEFAIILPAVMLVVGIVIGAIMLTGTRITLVSAAHDIARLEARGDASLASSRAQELPVGANVSSHIKAGILCTTVAAAPGKGILSVIKISGTGCAAVSAESS